jgi:pSer/pThr/pTyr-binding forkhead associated (FHA) protein
LPEPALRFLEYVFLALLYLFFLRVVRAVWVELREPRLLPAAQTTKQTTKAPGPDKANPRPQAAGSSRKARRAPQQLVVISADKSVEGTHRLADELTIGRAMGCAVSLPSDNFVSQVHARVFRKGDEYWVEDLGSTNGTLVNGRRLTAPAVLRRGDRLQVGRHVLELTK